MTLDLDERIVLVKRGRHYFLRYWNAVMGEMPIGPRLARGVDCRFPSLATKAETKMEGEELKCQWESWMRDRPKIKSSKKKIYS